MNNTNKLTITLAIICILLAASLAGVIANYTSIISAKDNTITSQDSTINNQNSQLAIQDAQITENNNTITSLNTRTTNQDSQITNLTSQVNSLNSQITTPQSQITTANSQISSLSSTVTTLQSQINNLTAIINTNKTQLQTLVFHVSEKGPGYIWGHLPNASDTYNQILALNNNTYNILLLPEYEGNTNWTEELAWLTTNFGGQHGIPIMLDVFEGGNGSAPIQMLSPDDILAAMATCNVQYLRFAELVSWYMAHPELPFPTAYITSILQFCRANNLKLFWTEWKAETFKPIQTYIKGYEDIVTVSFSTNSGDLEPATGFMQVSSMFQHWGASVQAWYWTTRYGTDPMNMPISLLIQHALSAKSLGAEIIEFEPYWYFFDNGQPNENLRLLETMLS